MQDLCHVYCMFMHTHTRIHQPSSMLAKQLMCYPVVSGHLYPQLCFMRLPLLVLVFVSLCVCFFSACLLSGAPGGTKAELPTEAVDCCLFWFLQVQQLVVWFFFLFLFFFFFFALPLSLSPGPVRHYYMLNIVTKINK